MEKAQHPLESLPVAAVAEWVAKVQVPLPLRERVDAYIARSGNTINLMRFRVATLTRPKSLTVEELVSNKINVKTLVADDGLAASLNELIQHGTVTCPKDLKTIGLEADDVLGPFTSPARYGRLSMTALKEAFPQETVRFLRDEFGMTPIAIMGGHAAYLRPSDFHALALRFDGKVMRHDSLVQEMRKHTKENGLFQAYPYKEWNLDAGLTDEYLGLLLGTTDKKQIEVLHKRLWSL